MCFGWFFDLSFWSLGLSGIFALALLLVFVGVYGVSVRVPLYWNLLEFALVTCDFAVFRGLI